MMSTVYQLSMISAHYITPGNYAALEEMSSRGGGGGVKTVLPTEWSLDYALRHYVRHI